MHIYITGPVSYPSNQGMPGLMNFPMIGQPPSRGATPMSEVGGIAPIQRPTTPSLETLAGLLDRNSTSLEYLNPAVGGTFSPTPGTATPTFSASSK